MDVEAVLGVGFRRQHLVKAVCGCIYNALCGRKDLNAPAQSGRHTDHIRRDVKDNAGLLTVGGAAVDLGTLLTVSAGEQKRDGGGKLGFAHLLGDLNICRVELAVTVRLQNTENVPYDLLLPVDQFKRLSRPGALGVAEVLDESNGIVRRLFVVI